MNDPIQHPTDDSSLSNRFDELVPVLIYRLADQLSQVAKQLFEKAYGIRFTDVRILTQLREEEGLSVAEISRRADVDKAWISRLVRELEDKGMIVRTPDPSDTRAVKITLTGNGRDLQNKVFDLAVSHEKTILNGIDRSQLISLLKAFECNLRDRSRQG